MYTIVSEDGIGMKGKPQNEHNFVLDVKNGNLQLNRNNPNISEALGEHSLIIQVSLTAKVCNV